MKLYRIILATEVDTNNLGCHTTSSWAVASKYDVSSNAYKFEKKEGQQRFIVWLNVKPEQINVEATKESNANYAHEKEVVLLPNQIVNAQVYCKGELIFKGKANTGTRYDKWVSEYL